jgi:hypothetical protein
LAARLAEFLEQARRTPFAWGQFDCILFLAGWSREIGAGDPGEVWRGRYATMRGAQRIIRQAGGLAELVEREFAPFGWRWVESAGAGDIGIVETVTIHGLAHTGGICLGDRWAALGPRGLVVAACQPLAVWRSPCLKP